MKKKLVSISITVLILCSSMFAFTASAHEWDWHTSTYSTTALYDHSNLKFQINSSAQTSLLTSAVYQGAFAWNNISSEVGGLSIAVISGSMPAPGFYPVNGYHYTDGTLGELIPYQPSGKLGNMEDIWQRVVIQMNTSASSAQSFYATSNPTEAAKKTFIHEVGHALKMKHPANNSSHSGHIYSGLPYAVMNQSSPNSSNHSGHIYSGLPYAVMNQSFPNSSNVASTVVTHDKDNLKFKWGA